MFDNIALDVFIGLVFIFLLYSLLSTIIQEMIATRFGFREKILEKAILRMLEDGRTTTRLAFGDRINGFLHLIGLKNLLKDKPVAAWFYAHPLIKYLAEDNYYSKPAYLDASNFSKVMIDLLKGFNQPESQVIQSIHNSIVNGSIYKLPISLSTAQADKSNPAYKSLIQQDLLTDDPTLTASQTVKINPSTALFIRSLWQEAGADIDVFRSKIEQWFNDTMDRATGWYKRYTRIILFIIGLTVAWAFNIDTIAIHRILSTNKPARDQMVQLAINEKDNLNPDKVLSKENTQSDSLLKKTYKMVSDDAFKANDILGLGKPWKDSCKTCEAKLGCDDKRNAYEKKMISLKQTIDSIGLLNTTIDSIKKAIAQKDADLLEKITLREKQQLQKDTSFLRSKMIAAVRSLEQYSNYNFDAIKDSLSNMATLYARCPIIQNRNCFQYSPNQRGGTETLLGWLITALAITLGAPFWFDLLSKLISLRGASSGKTALSDNNNTSANTNAAAPGNNSATTINVNTNSGEEAVG
jgi:hypothetical protein